MLTPSCPKCPRALAAEGGCPVHGPVTPLWRAAEPTYDAFAALLAAGVGYPTYLPWPLHPEWRVSDAGVVAADLDGSGEVLASVTACSGTSALDGLVDLLVVSEEPGTGLGSRVAGLDDADPGRAMSGGQPDVHVQIGPRSVALWSVSVAETDGDLDRSVLAGTEAGRWLWLVVRPAPAVLLLRDDWILRDVSDVGPPLVELPFGGPVPPW